MKENKLYLDKNSYESLALAFPLAIDDIDTEIIAMHYDIVWGERQRVFPQDFPLILWEYSLSFPPYNIIMHCDNFSIDIVYFLFVRRA